MFIFCEQNVYIFYQITCGAKRILDMLSRFRYIGVRLNDRASHATSDQRQAHLASVPRKLGFNLHSKAKRKGEAFSLPHLL
jgi:hypothetical protein